MEERWYQTEAKEAGIEYIENKIGHPLIVCPTGSGKSFILSSICQHFVRSGERVLVVSHVGEILEQDEEALLYLLPSDIVGVYSASLKRRERKQVTVAAIQSIYKKADLFTQYSLIIVDEAHTIPTKNEGMYRTLFNKMRYCTVLGLTATPYRTGSGMLTEGATALFDEIIYDVPVELLIQQGYLSPLLTKATDAEMNTEGMKSVAGDYSQKDLSNQFDRTEVTRKVINELIEYKNKYKSWLVFAIDIAHAENICEMLNESGIVSSTVHSKQVVDLWGNTRKETIAKFKAGEFQALVSVATLTTGFDHPGIDLVALVRPTKSPVLHVQMIGRGLRITKDKQHCLIMDFAGNIMRLGPINDVCIPPPPGERKKTHYDPPVKSCPDCNTHVPISAMKCYMCGHDFPAPQTKLTDKASALSAVIEKKASPVDWFPVLDTCYTKYLSTNDKLSMRVTYTVGNKKIHEYVNPFGNTKNNFNWKHWWTFRTDEPLPSSIPGMVSKADSLKKPVLLKVDFSGAYPRIKDASF